MKKPPFSYGFPMVFPLKPTVPPLIIPTIQIRTQCLSNPLRSTEAVDLHWCCAPLAAQICCFFQGNQKKNGHREWRVEKLKNAKKCWNSARTQVSHPGNTLRHLFGDETNPQNVPIFETPIESPYLSELFIPITISIFPIKKSVKVTTLSWPSYGQLWPSRPPP